MIPNNYIRFFIFSLFILIFSNNINSQSFYFGSSVNALAIANQGGVEIAAGIRQINKPLEKLYLSGGWSPFKNWVLQGNFDISNEVLTVFRTDKHRTWDIAAGYYLPYDQNSKLNMFDFLIGYSNGRLSYFFPNELKTGEIYLNYNNLYFQTNLHLFSKNNRGHLTWGLKLNYMSYQDALILFNIPRNFLSQITNLSQSNPYLIPELIFRVEFGLPWCRIYLGASYYNGFNETVSESLSSQFGLNFNIDNIFTLLSKKPDTSK